MRDRYLKRWKKLLLERSTWDSHYQDIADHLLPRSIRLTSSRRNQGTKQNQKIYNNTATRAHRILTAGMMAGITSPARRWFRLSAANPMLSSNHRVRRWLSDTEDLMYDVYARSNIYQALQRLYKNISAFGTQPILITEDFGEEVIRATVPPVGSYACMNDSRGKINVLYRRITFSAAQLKEKFGEDNLSTEVQDALRNGRPDEMVDVIHVLEPNDNPVMGVADFRGMAIRSLWFEEKGRTDKMLSQGGFEEFPAMVPRWDVVGEDIYGESPAMDALPDIRALQKIERRKGQVLDKIVNPPLVGPSSLSGARVSLLSGDITFVDNTGRNQNLEPLIKIDPQAFRIREEAEAHEQRIGSAFFADLFLMLANTAIPNMTAREVDERHEEKVLQLGPVLERLNDELFDPLTDRTFNILARRGMIPDPPEELQGQPLKVEYISILAQAQKLLGTVGVERLASFVIANREVFVDIADKVDSDRMVDIYSDLLGVDPDIVRSDDEVSEIRTIRAQQQAEQMAMEAKAARDAAAAAKDASQVDLTDQGALQQLLASTGGQAHGEEVAF